MVVVCKYFLLYIIYSFLGWLLEVIVTFVSSKKIINRGFLIGPYCPVYGKGALLIILLLKKYENDIPALFVMSFAICSIVEYITGYVLEKIFNTRWWDYSNRKFNINGRVCLQNLVAFGMFGILMVQYINPFLLGLICKLSNSTIIILSIIIFIIFLCDSVISIRIISKFHNYAKSINVDSTELVTKFVRQEIKKKNKYLYNRIINAFPKLKIHNIKKKKKN